MNSKRLFYHFGPCDPRCGEIVAWIEETPALFYCPEHGNLNYSGEVYDAREHLSDDQSNTRETTT